MDCLRFLPRAAAAGKDSYHRIRAVAEDYRDLIQNAYRSWLGGRGFRPRRGQREMIAFVTRALTGDRPRLCVIEAGTGTGKTAAYCLAVIPIAQALGGAGADQYRRR